MRITKKIPKLTEVDLAKFEACVEKKEEGCWEWLASTKPAGHGQICLQGSILLAHRVAYAIAYGDPGQLQVNHKCNNPKCCRPDHLYAGTQQQNLLDIDPEVRMLRNGRLTFLQVLHIFYSARPQKELMDLYGVVRSTVSQIQNKKHYRHWTKGLPYPY